MDVNRHILGRSMISFYLKNVCERIDIQLTCFISDYPGFALSKRSY